MTTTCRILIALAATLLIATMPIGWGIALLAGSTLVECIRERRERAELERELAVVLADARSAVAASRRV